MVAERREEEKKKPKDSGHSVVSKAALGQLTAHVAVRIVDGGSRSHDEPLPVSLSIKKAAKFSLSLRSVASRLSSRGACCLEERHIAIEESTTHTVQFVVRHVGGANAVYNGKGSGGPGSVITSYPLLSLADVFTFSVSQKDMFPFKLLPPGFSHLPDATEDVEEGAGGGVQSVSPLSTSFNQPGDVGLCLVFEETPPTAAARRQFRRVEMEFVSSKGRGVWLHRLGQVYTSFLLDSVRAGDGRSISAADTKGLMERSARLMRERPPPAVVGRYIDFFISSPAGGEAKGAQVTQCADTKDVPCGGILRVDLGEGRYETRRFACKRPATCSESGEEACLVMYPTTVSQRVRMVSKQQLPIGRLRVVVEEEHRGNTFFLEQTATAADLRAGFLLSSGKKPLTKFQSAFTASSFDKSGDFVVTETIRLQANDFSDRLRWLRWFETVLGRPIVYLSRVREERETREWIRSPSSRATTSLYPRFTAENGGEG